MAALMRDPLNCPICLDRFVYPKLLRCGHTFCQFCLEQLTPPDASVIICLTCQSTTPKPDGGVEGLPHNYNIGESTVEHTANPQRVQTAFDRDVQPQRRTANVTFPARQQNYIVGELTVGHPVFPQRVQTAFNRDLQPQLSTANVTFQARQMPPAAMPELGLPHYAAGLKQLQIVPGAEKGEKCGMCHGGGAVVCCIDCHKYMCQKCLKRHNVREALACHTILKISNLKKCDEHGENCSHVCVDCGHLVCVACTQDDCSEHSVRRIGDAARRHIGDGDLKARLLQSRTSYNKLREKRVEKYSSIEDEIHKTTNKLHLMLKAEEAKMLRDLKASEDNCLAGIDTLRQEEEEQIRAIAQAHVDSAQPLQYGIPSTILLALPKIEALSSKRQKSTVVPTFQPGREATVGELRQNTIETKRVFRFEKIVLVKRDSSSTLLGKDGDIIVRNDFKGATDNFIQLFRRGTDREYHMEDKLLAKLPSIFNRDWRPYIPNIRQMTYRIKDYARANHLQLNKIVIKTQISNDNV